MEMFVTPGYNPVDQAADHVVATMRLAPHASLHTYRSQWSAYNPAALHVFEACMHDFTDIITRLEEASAEAYEASLYGGMLGAMIIRSAYPNVVATQDFTTVYKELAARVSDDGSLSLRKQAAEFHLFADTYSLTLKSATREHLHEAARSITAQHDRIAYTTLMITLYLYARMMHTGPSLSAMVSSLDEPDFDTVLDIIASGHGSFLEA